MNSKEFFGSITALVTPFKDGNIDETAFADFVEWQIQQGTNGLVPVGTTGESPTLSHEEHKKIVALCVEIANGRVPVMAGAGSNNTLESLEYAAHAKQVGANAILVVTPYYNKPSQKGMVEHFSTIAKNCDLPLYIYNIPGRSIVDMHVETISELFNAHKNIVGIKDATAEVDRVTLQKIACGDSLIQLSGDDGTALGFNAHGGVGCISVSANVAPKLCSQFHEACKNDNFTLAQKLHEKLMPLHKALFLEPSPAGPKYALSLLGKMNDEVRSPIVPLEEKTKKTIKAAMMHAEIING